MKGFRRICLFAVVLSIVTGDILTEMPHTVSAADNNISYLTSITEQEVTSITETTVSQQEESNVTQGEESSNIEESSCINETSSYQETSSQVQTTKKAEPTTKKEQPTTQQPTTKKEQPTQTAWTKKNGKYYNDRNEVIPGAIKKGMDISHHQGIIDWKAVKKSDIDFVIIRCGFGDNYKSQDDKYFKYNVEMCTKYNIPYGIYLYSYAMNMTQVKSEVKHTLRLLKEVNAKPTYPVFYDLEEGSQYRLGADTVYSFAKYYCTQMIKKGYKAGIYSSYYWWTTLLTDKRYDQWYRWVARYNSYCGYIGSYIMWQSTSSGIVPGVAGRTDLNFLMYDECEKNGHSKKWIVTGKPTVLKEGSKKCVCKKCGKILKYAKIAKLKPTGHLKKKKVTLKYKEKYKKLSVVNLAYGDYVKKYTTSDKKIATVNKKGVITAKNKKGTCKITVWLASGKTLKFKVNVKKKTK
ncbi:MAG: glycoside hydrolase family 25 protein [Lachnospiraceae bacterium]|nr:glycoside hydrolase family 25 protein [Lachnospiraceae bacterium]